MHAVPADDFGGPLSVIDRLSSPAVLLVTATGYQPGATGLIEQCTAQGCGNSFPVTFGDDGAARLQYLVEAEVRTGPGDGRVVSTRRSAVCRAGEQPRSIAPVPAAVMP